MIHEMLRHSEASMVVALAWCLFGTRTSATTKLTQASWQISGGSRGNWIFPILIGFLSCIHSDGNYAWNTVLFDKKIFCFFVFSITLSKIRRLLCMTRFFTFFSSRLRSVLSLINIHVRDTQNTCHVSVGLLRHARHKHRVRTNTPKYYLITDNNAEIKLSFWTWNLTILSQIQLCVCDKNIDKKQSAPSKKTSSAMAVVLFPGLVYPPANFRNILNVKNEIHLSPTPM